jgi:hypothetical protein
LVVCKLIGFSAKNVICDRDWRLTQTLFWNGIELKRNSKEYANLITRAYIELFSQCVEAREALLATGSEILTHNIGKINKNETVLTRTEFCDNLMKIRQKYNNEKILEILETI